jgi:hypothetical protein
VDRGRNLTARTPVRTPTTDFETTAVRELAREGWATSVARSALLPERWSQHQLRIGAVQKLTSPQPVNREYGAQSDAQAPVQRAQ